MRSLSLCMSLVVLLFVTACSLPVTRVDVQSFELNKKGIQMEQALTRLTGVLVNRGFDIKLTNKDAGLITTEYKQFASSGTNPPFDYYLQIRGRVKINGSDTNVALVPMVKEQNRLNAAAYSEHALSYYTGDPSNVRLIGSMREGVGWRVLGQVSFMNVVQDTAEQLGLKVEDIVQKVTNTPDNAFSAN